MQVKKQQLELDTEQQTASKSGEEYIKAVYCHPAYLTYAEYIMGNAGLDEAQAAIKIVGENINNLICRWHHPYDKKQKETKEPFDEIKRGAWKIWLNTQHSEN